MSVLKQRNSLLAVLLAGALLVVGFVLMLLNADGRLWWQSVLFQLGMAIFIAVVFTGLWEWWGKRLLAQEVYELVGVGVDIQRWGLRSVSMDWPSQKWTELFEASYNVDVLLAYGATWRGLNQTALETFLRDPRRTLRVCLPDPEEEWLMRALAERFSKNPVEVAEKIREATRHFFHLRQEGGATVSVFYRPGEPVYSIYRFESVAVLTLYPHRRERSQTPTLVAGPGELFSFVREDYEKALQMSREVAQE